MRLRISTKSLKEYAATVSMMILIVYMLWLQISWHSNMIMYICITCNLFFLLLNRIKIDIIPAYGLFLIITGLFGCLVTINGGTFSGTFSTLLKAYVFLICVVNTCKLRKGLNHIFIAVIIAGLGLSLNFMLTDVGVNSLTTRVSLSDTMNENVLAISIVLAIYVSLYRLTCSKTKIEKIVSIGLLVLMYAAAMLSGTRKAFLTALIIIVGYFFWVEKASSMTSKSIIKRAVIIIVGMVAVYFAIKYAFEKTAILSRLQNIGYEGDKNRAFYYRTAWELFCEKPILGHGWGGFSNRVGMYSHSTYAELISNTGLVGTILYLFFIGQMMSRLIKGIRTCSLVRDKKIKKMALIGIAVIIFLGTSTAVFYEMNLSLWIGIIYVISRNYYAYDEKSYL